MQTCCCWQSVRKGSYACSVYTLIYYSLLAWTTSTIFLEESQYLKGNVSLPKSSSLLESGTISPTTIRFNGMLLICSCCGVLCSLLLLYGLLKNHKLLLIPWIIVIITTGITDLAHTLYLLIATLDLSPTKVMIYTFSFFLLCLNIYSLLCVISQYQEYSAGRGTAAHEYRVPVVRYMTQPPTTTATTSCPSSRRGVTNNETKATPTQSPTICHNPLLSEKSPSTGSRVSRKHVQFPSSSQIERPGNEFTVIAFDDDPVVRRD